FGYIEGWRGASFDFITFKFYTDASDPQTFVGQTSFDVYTKDVEPEILNAAPTVTNEVYAASVAHDATTGLPTPFAGVTIGDDGDEDDEVTVTITLDTATEGAIVIPTGVAGSYNAETGVYTVTGTVDDVNDAIQALQFNPIDRTAHGE